MTRDEIREIADVVEGDDKYNHFVRRINKEFDISDEQRNANVYVLFQRDKKGRRIGFVVIGHSPAKMAVWKKTFLDEGWVSGEFQMADDPFELMYMYVKPEFRDKGYGVNLFDKLTSFTRKKGISEIYAYVSDDNDDALKFYQKVNGEILYDFSDEEFSSAFLRWKL